MTSDFVSSSESPYKERCLDFDTIYRDNASFLWFVLRRLGVPESSIDDVFQETFLTIHRRIDSFEGRAPLRSWLYGVAVRVARSYHRRASVRRLFFSDFSEGYEPVDPLSGVENVERREALALVDQLLEKLPRKRREVFVLVEIEGLTAKEVAPIVGCNVNTVYSRLRLAREAFGAALARHRTREDRWRTR
jgi:RNA polymerase sigma-70 factor (ECF subfamily)